MLLNFTAENHVSFSTLTTRPGELYATFSQFILLTHFTTWSERQLPRVTLDELEISDVIKTLRGVAAGMDINVTYNTQDMVENNLIKGTRHYVPDNIEEAQTMRFQVMSLLNSCPNSVSSDFRNIITGVKRWVRRLRGKGEDKEHCDFMMRKFQWHMEDVLFHTPIADNYDVRDRILQWGSLLDRKRNELRN